MRDLIDFVTFVLIFALGYQIEKKRQEFIDKP